MSDKTVRGACYCGAVAYEADLPSKFVCHCHCKNCQRAHGAGVVTWTGFKRPQFRLTSGETLRRHVTDTGATRSFCGTCGTPLFYESPRWAEDIHIAVATLLDPIDAPPKAHVYADRSPAWCPINDDLPRYGGESGTEPLT
ncbi:MAG: GFA family protein [Acidobacteriota bacterium]